MNKILYLLRKISNKGFFEIVFSSTIVKALMFMSAMFLPRFLTIDDYAILTYSETIINYFLAFTGLGLSTSVLKYCSIETISKQKEKGYLKFSIKTGSLFNIVIVTLLIFFSMIFSYKVSESRYVIYTTVKNYFSKRAVLPKIFF